MKKYDFLWGVILSVFIAILGIPSTHKIFIEFTTSYPYIGGFIKFAVLATMGELLAIRISTGDWNLPNGLIYRALIWGILGMGIVLIFNVFAFGIQGALSKDLLPGGKSKLAFAFFTSMIMNLTFAPVMMVTHRITDTIIDLKYDKEIRKITMSNVLINIDWNNFVSFVLFKTIPLFWIPAHTITFLLPPEYRVVTAALLSIALGALLSLKKKRK